MCLPECAASNVPRRSRLWQLGMSVVSVAKSMVGMEGFVRTPLASNDEAASTSREGPEEVDEQELIIVSEDGLEIGYAYPSWHLGVKRHVLGTSVILGMNRHLLGTQSQASGYDFAEYSQNPVSRNSSGGVSQGVSPGAKAVRSGGSSNDAMSPTTPDPEGVKLSMLRPSAHHLDIKPIEKPAPPMEEPPPMPGDDLALPQGGHPSRLVRAKKANKQKIKGTAEDQEFV